MNKIEECWVIQRDDGMYVNFECNNELLVWFEKIWQSSMICSKNMAQHEIDLWQLKNCKPVKVEIRVVGE